MEGDGAPFLQLLQHDLQETNAAVGRVANKLHLLPDNYNILSECQATSFFFFLSL